VRLKFAQFAIAFLIFGAFAGSPARAQRADTMMPEESAARGKQLLNDLINAFGGPGYTEVHESECDGRRALFGHNGELTGYINFRDFRRYPDKDRTEYIGKGRNTILQSLIGIDGLDFAHGGIIIALYDGDRGWTYDRSGVSEMPITSISEFQEQTKRSIENLLRFRLKEPGLMIRYGGPDTVDLREVEWVEITDTDERKFRLAVNHSTHLLVRAIVSTKNEDTQQIDDDTTIYTNYQLHDSVWFPTQLSREHNGRRTAQIFYETCRFNPGLPDDLFSKESLQKGGSEAVLKKSKN
jgi:outer membrane lipoprotein-sorting protein